MAVSRAAASASLRSALSARVVSLYRQICRDIPRIMIMCVDHSLAGAPTSADGHLARQRAGPLTHLLHLAPFPNALSARGAPLLST